MIVTFLRAVKVLFSLLFDAITVTMTALVTTRSLICM